MVWDELPAMCHVVRQTKVYLTSEETGQGQAMLLQFGSWASWGYLALTGGVKRGPSKEGIAPRSKRNVKHKLSEKWLHSGGSAEMSKLWSQLLHAQVRLDQSQDATRPVPYVFGDGFLRRSSQGSSDSETAKSALPVPPNTGIIVVLLLTVAH